MSTWYREGTISLTKSSAVVTGAGTQFKANVRFGDILLVNGALYEISRVESDAKLQLATPYTGSTVSGQAFAVIRNINGASNFDLMQKIEEFLGDRQRSLDEFADWLAGEDNGGPNSDGLYPLTDRYNVTIYAPSVRKLTKSLASIGEDVEEARRKLDALGDQEAWAAQILGYKNAAETAANTATTKANAASSSATSAANSASTATTKASEASTSASTASTKASEAASSASSAATSASNAASSEAKAAKWADANENVAVETGKYSAKHHALKAAASASSASSSASTATTKASEAASSATSAASSASTATSKASAASTSATNAANSASTASTKATEAANSASTASTKASEAATSATNAANSATKAASWAEANENVAVESGKYSAKHHAIKAAASATAASSSASTASTKASEAASSATAAASSASTATSKASAANTSATNAANSATTASTKASEAADSASTAATKASEAASSASSASTSATNAANSATKAASWAEANENVAVETGKYSAKHHALKAAASASEAASSASTATSKASAASTSATNAANSATAAANSASTASTKASEASTSASQAANSASTAVAKAGEAADSAATAQSSANTAVSAKNAAETARDEAVNAAASVMGALVELGGIDLSSGSHPPKPTQSAFWKVTVGGVVNGIDYGPGDTLVYSKNLDTFYKIDNTESVTSVNGKQGVVVINAEDVDALPIEGGQLGGRLILADSGQEAPLNIPLLSADPTILVNGDLWQRANNLYVRLGGATRTLLHSASYSTVSQAEAEAGTATTTRFWTSLRVRQSTIAWWEGSDAKSKLDTIEEGAQVNTVLSVNSKTGEVVLSKADVGLGNVSNVDTTNAANISAGILPAARLSGNYAISVTSADRLTTARTINGTSFDGSANITTSSWGASRTLSFTGDATGSASVNGSSNVAFTLTLADSGVTAGTYSKVTVDSKGRVVEGAVLVAADIPNLDASKITSGTLAAARIPTLNQNTTGNAATATQLQTARTINGTSFDGSANITTANWGTARTLSFTGDATGSASVNGSANVAFALTLTNSGVTAGTYAKVTVDAKGRVTAGASLVEADIPTLSISKISNLSTELNGKASTSTSITAGDGLTGGGTLAASRTISIANNAIPLTATYLGSADLNDVTTPGFYVQDKNADALASRNYPDGGGIAGALVVTKAAGIVQEYTCYGSSNRKFVRGQYGDVWSSWKEIYRLGSGVPVADIPDLDASKITSGTIAAARIPTLNQNTTGNAGTATKLATARTINGTSFDGSANITTSKWGTSRTLSFTGDATGSGAVDGSANVAFTLTLANSGVTAGTYAKVTVDSKGRVTAGSSLAAGDIPNLDAGKITSGTLADARIPNLSADKITSGTIANARLTGVYDGITLKINGSNTVFTTPSSGSSNSAARTVYGLAEFRSSASSTVGAIVFIAPDTTHTVMHEVEIAGLLYSQNVVRLTIQGYRSGASGNWTAMRKISTGTVDVPARWGLTPDGKACIILGDVDSTWSYPHFSIIRAMFSHSNVSDAYCSGWTTALVTDLAEYTRITSFISDSAMVGSISGNAGSATKLATARTINGTSFNGTGNITTANWGTARTLSFTGDVTGSESVNGSANVAFTLTLTDSGVTAGTYAKVTVDSKGRVTAGESLSASDIPNLDASKITSGTIAAARIPTLNQNTTGNAATATKLATARTINGVAFDGSANITITAAANGGTADSATTATKLATARTINGVSFDGTSNITITAAANGGTSAACSGNAATATKLATARTINGTSFDGSANITTANWGTARTLTVGNTSKSVNGSANVSWTLAEIGAAAASHTHSYLPLSGGSLTGQLNLGSNSGSSWIGGTSGSNAAIRYNASAASSANWHAWIAGRDSGNNGWAIGTLGNAFHVSYATASNISAGTNSTTQILRITPTEVSVTANFTASGNVTAYSDIRLKKNIKRIENALSKVDKLNGVTFTRKDTGEVQTGLIAQDVLKVLPEAVSGGEYLGVAYGNLAGLLVEAIKELTRKVEEQQARIDELERRVAA